MNSNEQSKVGKLADKVSNFTDEKTTSLGESLESANEKAADLKERAESGYDRKISPAIDSAQIELAGASRYLQESSVDDFIRDLEGYAKRHPRITAGICALIGWKLGRALKFSK